MRRVSWPIFARIVAIPLVGLKTVVIGEEVQVLGSIIAPIARVRVMEDAAFKGAICANEIVVERGVTFLPHGSAMPLP